MESIFYSKFASVEFGRNKFGRERRIKITRWIASIIGKTKSIIRKTKNMIRKTKSISGNPKWIRL